MRRGLIARGFLFCLPLVLLVVCSNRVIGQTDRFRGVREQMVAEVIQAEGIDNPDVIRAMKTVPRHLFVPPAQRSAAYVDAALAIGSGQTISPPYVVAYMTSVLEPQPEDRVLEIGTGSGYQAAVLSEIVREVYSVEIVPELARAAERRLKELDYKNVFVRAGDGYKGWEEHAPFDRIIVTCSPEAIPEPLIEQLADGGTMIIPVGRRYQQSFVLLRKNGDALEQEKLISTLFVPMTGASEDQRVVQPNPLRPVVVNGGFEGDENGDERPDGWHYQRQAEICDEMPMEGDVCIRFRNSSPGELSQMLQGTAISGQRIGALDVSVWGRPEGAAPGQEASDQASVLIHFYDHIRRDAGTVLVARWRGTHNWQQSRRRVPVPKTAREMILRVGLNGGVGTLDLDDLRMIPVYRSR